MTWFLFMDESGQSRGEHPMEVRGGIAINSANVQNFIHDFHDAEKEIFGIQLSDYNKEVKANRLLSRETFKWLEKSSSQMIPKERYKYVKEFLENNNNTNECFVAYGQARILMADRIFYLLEKYEAKILATAFSKKITQPTGIKRTGFLREDHKLLQKLYFTLLEEKQEKGFLVMDRSSIGIDNSVIKSLKNYYKKTEPGKNMAQRITITPFFVDSATSPLIQAADVCIYCINWGYRHKSWGFNGNKREEIAERYGDYCKELQFISKTHINKNNKEFKYYGIKFVKEPYKKERLPPESTLKKRG